MKNPIQSIEANAVFNAKLDALISTEIENEHIDEAQETAISAAWSVLIAIVDWHMPCAVTDSLRPEQPPQAV